ncbi:MAG TPA: serine hydrolase [Phenylobacterium sp.]|nr:serine hydrolase [Phenylobacterium sp.]
MTPGERPTDGPQFVDGLSRGAPSGAGVDADAVIAFLDEVEARGLELHSFMLYRAGRVVAEAWWWPFGPERPRIMHSLAKSLTSCAIGLAIADGALSLDDKVIGFFPEHLPARVDANLAAMTVEDLLTMRTGHASEVGGSLWRGIDASWIDEFFKIPVVHPPGATYVYSSAASYMLAAILHRATGKTLHQYLRPRLFEPLSIRGETWDVGPDGINPGGNGFTGKTSDVLKLGALMAQGGVWEGRQLLPRAWVELATRPHANNGRYGYHWVTYENGAYAAVGMFVQMVMVFPDQGATLALTGAIESSENVLPVIFEHFPTAFRAAPFRATGADARLKARLASIAGERRLPAAGVDGDWSRAAHSFAVEPNPLGVIELRFEITADACVFHITDAEGRHSVACGRETWIEGQTDVPGRELHHGYRLRGATVVARARWLDATTLEMVWIFADTAFRDTVTCRFAQGRVSVDREVNINSAARRHPTLVGRLA